MSAPVMINLKDLAVMLNIQLVTLYGDWPERVRLGQIPPADPRYKRPTWHGDQVKAWLAAPPLEKAKRQKGRVQADPEAEALRARMTRNREGKSHAA